MRKIPTLFERDRDNNPRFVTRQVTPGCFWVQDAELPSQEGMAVATRKYDGTCFMFDGRQWWSRREVKPGKRPPQEFRAIATDDDTGKTVGWEPAHQSSFARQGLEAFARQGGLEGGAFSPATYELCGPSVNGNPEGLEQDVLIQHGLMVLEVADRSYDGLVTWFGEADPRIEGLVFWFQQGNPEGGMVKIKRRDFRELAE